MVQSGGEWKRRESKEMTLNYRKKDERCDKGRKAKKEASERKTRPSAKKWKLLGG